MDLLSYLPVEINYRIFSYLKDRLGLLTLVHPTWKSFIQEFFKPKQIITKVNVLKESWELVEWYRKHWKLDTKQKLLALLSHSQFEANKEGIALVYENPHTIIGRKFLMRLAQQGRLDFLKQFPHLNELIFGSKNCEWYQLQYYFLFCCKHLKVVEWFLENVNPHHLWCYHHPLYLTLKNCEKPRTKSAILSIRKFGLPHTKVPPIHLNQEQFQNLCQTEIFRKTLPCSQYNQLLELYLKSKHSVYTLSIKTKNLKLFKELCSDELIIDSPRFCDILLQKTIIYQFYEGYVYLLSHGIVDANYGIPKKQLKSNLDYRLLDTYLSNLEINSEVNVDFLDFLLANKVDKNWFVQFLEKYPIYKNFVTIVDTQNIIPLLMEVCPSILTRHHVKFTKTIHRANITDTSMIECVLKIFQGYGDLSIEGFWSILSFGVFEWNETSKMLLKKLIQLDTRECMTCYIYNWPFFAFVERIAYKITDSSIMKKMVKYHTNLRIIKNDFSVVGNHKMKPILKLSRSFLKMCVSWNWLPENERFWPLICLVKKHEKSKCVNYLMQIRYPCTLSSSFVFLCENLVKIDQLSRYHDYVCSFSENTRQLESCRSCKHFLELATEKHHLCTFSIKSHILYPFQVFGCLSRGEIDQANIEMNKHFHKFDTERHHSQ